MLRIITCFTIVCIDKKYVGCRYCYHETVSKFFFILLSIKFSDRYWSIFSVKKEFVLLVELYESYGQLKHTTCTH